MALKRGCSHEPRRGWTATDARPGELWPTSESAAAFAAGTGFSPGEKQACYTGPGQAEVWGQAMRRRRLLRPPGQDVQPLPWDGMTPAQAAKLARDAYRLAAWYETPRLAGDVWRGPEGFYESLARAFEALLAHYADQRGHGWCRGGYGDGAFETLAEMPSGWRPRWAAQWVHSQRHGWGVGGVAPDGERSALEPVQPESAPPALCNSRSAIAP